MERWRRSQVNTPSLSHDRKALIDGSVATASEKVPIMAEANTENSRFAPGSAHSVRFVAFAIFLRPVFELSNAL